MDNKLFGMIKSLRIKIALLTFTLLIASATVTWADTPEVKASYRPKDDDVLITWELNFKPDSYSLTGTINQPPLGDTHPDFTKYKTTITPDDVLNPKKWTFVVTLPYGNAGVITPQTQYAYLTINAASGPAGAPTQSAKADLTLNVEGIKDYMLMRKLLTTTAPFEPAQMVSKQFVKASDRSITANFTVSQGITATIFAFEDATADPAVGATSTFKIENQILPANKSTEVRVPNLRSGHTYRLVVSEVPPPHNPTGRPLLWDVLTFDNTGNPIRTKDAIKRPTVRVLGKPYQVRNSAVHVEISATDATSVIAYVITRDRNGNANKLSEETPISIKQPGSDKTLYSGDIPVALDEGTLDYQVVARATTNLTDDDNVSEDASVSFNGLSRKLFDHVSYEVNNSGMKFSLQGVTPGTPISTKVAIDLNGKELLTPCSKSGAVCEFELPKVMAALATPASNAGSAANASEMVFTVTAQADDQSGRTQTATFAIVTSSTAPVGTSSNAVQKAAQFVKSALTGSGNPSLKANEIKGSGIAGFLGALLRGFIAL